MKRTAIILILALLFPLAVVSKSDPNVVDVKDKHKSILGKSKLFKVVEAKYDKGPELVNGMNIYTMVLKVKKRHGEGVLTFVKNPKDENGKPEYRTLVLKVFKPLRRKVEKEYQMPLHLKSDQVMAVYYGQELIISWHGDGAFNAKGWHFFSYNEKLTK